MQASERSVFPLRLCHTPVCLSLLTKVVLIGPDMPPSCLPVKQDVYMYLIVFLALRTSEAYSILISHGCVPSVSTSPPPSPWPEFILEEI